MWDVGGQKSLRSYWRNYFEQTDGIIWVVDSADFDRVDDCKRELSTLLVSFLFIFYVIFWVILKRYFHSIFFYFFKPFYFVN